MRCFYHPDVDAVGICKNCGRGLCPQSLAEVENGLACKGRCEALAEAINALVTRNQRAMARPRSVGLFILVLLGLALVAMGIQIAAADIGLAGLFIAAGGSVLLASGAFSYLYMNRPRRPRGS